MKLDWMEWAVRAWAGGWALEPSPGDSVTMILSKATRTKAGAGSRKKGWKHGLSHTALNNGYNLGRVLSPSFIQWKSRDCWWALRRKGR